MTLSDILQDSSYRLTQFDEAMIAELENNISVKKSKNKEVPYTECLVRIKEIKLTPEEIEMADF